MRPFRRVTSRAVPLPRDNVDTDQIVPKQFLKATRRTGFGGCLFFGWRYAADGSPDPGFVLNDPAYRGAEILVAGRNFGCGSSREHAVWALRDYGFSAVIAPSFADIFRGNCHRNGVLPVGLPEGRVAELQAWRGDVTVDLEAMSVEAGGRRDAFEVGAHAREMLLGGLDEIDVTLRMEGRISEFERGPSAPSALRSA